MSLLQSALDDWEKMASVGFNPLIASEPTLFSKETTDKVRNEVMTN